MVQLSVVCSAVFRDVRRNIDSNRTRFRLFRYYDWLWSFVTKRSTTASHTTFIFFEMLATRNMNACSQYTVTQNLHVSSSDRNAIHRSINQLLRLRQNSLPRTTEVAAQTANNLLAARVLRFRAIPVVSFIIVLQSPSITPVYYYKGWI